MSCGRASVLIERLDRYKQLNEVDRKLAVETFDKNKGFYHPICKVRVEKILGLTK